MPNSQAFYHISRIPDHPQLERRVQKLVWIIAVMESDEANCIVEEDLVKDIRHAVGVSEMKDQAPVVDGELQCVRRKWMKGVWIPLDAETDDEAALAVAVAVEVKHGLKPVLDDGGEGGYGDGYSGSVQVDNVDFVVGMGVVAVDCGHFLNRRGRNGRERKRERELSLSTALNSAELALSLYTLIWLCFRARLGFDMVR